MADIQMLNMEQIMDVSWMSHEKGTKMEVDVRDVEYGISSQIHMPSNSLPQRAVVLCCDQLHLDWWY